MESTAIGTLADQGANYTHIYICIALRDACITSHYITIHIQTHHNATYCITLQCMHALHYKQHNTSHASYTSPLSYYMYSVHCGIDASHTFHNLPASITHIAYIVYITLTASITYVACITYTRIHVHAYIQTNICAYRKRALSIYVRVQIHAHAYTSINSHMHNHNCMHIQSIHKYLCVRTHMYV